MYQYYVRKVEGVVDGDTIDVLIDLGFDILFSSRVRLAGIDTPESRTKDLKEKALGLESKEYLKKALKDAMHGDIWATQRLRTLMHLQRQERSLASNESKRSGNGRAFNYARCHRDGWNR
jgi:endonuclease YncB( thermonuclease family)